MSKHSKRSQINCKKPERSQRLKLKQQKQQLQEMDHLQSMKAIAMWTVQKMPWKRTKGRLDQRPAHPVGLLVWWKNSGKVALILQKMNKCITHNWGVSLVMSEVNTVVCWSVRHVRRNMQNRTVIVDLPLYISKPFHVDRGVNTQTDLLISWPCSSHNSI